VVGADGRRSSVRSQASIPFEVDQPAHLVAGMLAEGVGGPFAEVNLIAREADLQFLSFPQSGGRARLYFCFPTEQRSRFAGAEGAERFLSATKLGCLSEVTGLDGARAAGPCATFPAQDSRAPFPLADGVVLIGDAAGYENPLEGQGLSMALQDVHDVTAALMSGSSRCEALEAYASARAGRQKLANLATTLEVWANEGFVEQDPQKRAARYDFIQNDEVLTAIAGSYSTGFDSLPKDFTPAGLNQRLQECG
jgi:2-polyprenyl-6-methoxyphenol hydroxylase-like FAD-dependent oxidoreductase